MPLDDKFSDVYVTLFKAKAVVTVGPYHRPYSRQPHNQPLNQNKPRVSGVSHKSAKEQGAFGEFCSKSDWSLGMQDSMQCTLVLYLRLEG